MADDWSRRKAWTTKDREEFFTRLRRSRTAYHKAQYARLQAFELLATHTRSGYLAALELLDMALTESREDAQLDSIYHHRAECYIGLGDLPRAIDAYREVFKTQRMHKGSRTGAHLDFGWLVATTPLPELYDEALPLLDEFKCDLLPIHRYRSHAIQALIMGKRGQHETARTHARIALQEANARHSGFRYHATLGLVESPSENIQRQLQALAI